mgnify:FL=1
MAKKKDFDCVEMKHHAAAEIHKELKGKTIEERLDYWNKVYSKQKKRQLEMAETKQDG